MSVAEEIGFKRPHEHPRGRLVPNVVRDLPPGVVRLCVGCGYRMQTDREHCERCMVWGDSPPVMLTAPIVPDEFAACTRCGRQRWTDDTPVCHRCLALS